MTQPDHEEQTEVIAEGRYRPKECASRQKRRAAAELFAAGIGYTKASRILDLPVNTLRDWAKAWKAGKFTEDPKLPGMHLVPEHPRGQGQT